MKYPLKVAAFAATCLLMSVLYSCTKDDNTDNPSNTPKSNVKVATNATFGKILTDSLGNTLYFFSLDANGQSACTSGDCLAAWPVFYKEKLTLDTALKATDFATITRTDGAKQTTYKGWPLYYYSPDGAAGDVKGDAVGNVWFVAKPDYTVMLANQQLTGNDGIQYKSDLTPGTQVTQFITDPYGRTLYAFSNDKSNTNLYTKEDLSNDNIWPIYPVSTVANVPSTLTKSDFATTQIWARVQITYKGWPLYYFGADAQTRGNTKGVSVPRPGVWPYVNNNSTAAPLP
jgi:predicted lipoprotein with Yx(FWY)xxD motif